MTQNTFQEKIEILSLDLFKTHRDEMNIITMFHEYFGHTLGWHYYLDLAWILRSVKSLPRGALLLDAGAGNGLLQFILAELGYNVISADFTDRDLPQKYVKRYGKVIHYLNSQNKVFDNRYLRHLKKLYAGRTGVRIPGFEPFKKKEKRIDIISLIEKNRYNDEGFPVSVLESEIASNGGRIFMYKCDLRDMSLLPDNFVDGVVSVSALEHNDHADLEKCVDEMLRITKPAGRMFMTVSASLSEDCFHEPSKGWCYSEISLKKLFRLSGNVKNNFDKKYELFNKLCSEGNELYKRLDPAYYKSGDNGMPWGIWDPKYQPVGICKITGYIEPNS